MRPAGFEPATKGFERPRVSARLGLSHPPPLRCPSLRNRTREAGRSGRGLLLGLTPLVSEPSWPPMPDQAWLRITMPRKSLGSPQFTRIATGGCPPAPPFSFDESPALP